MGYCCRIFTPVQPVYPAASVRDFVSGALTKGRLLIKLRDGEVRIGPGEFVVIPRGVDHLPVAEEEVHVILIEPKTTLNTGNVVGHKTVAHLEKI
jgi:homogentisate 1,2-dioxygenase